MSKVQKSLGLVAHWQVKASYYHESAQQPLSPKQAGQLKQLARKLGPYARDTVDYAFANWAKFTTQAKFEKGTSTSPDVPHTGFLLAHYGVAINMMIHDKVINVADFAQAMNILYPDQY